MTLRPKNWDQFQHYKDRRPKWIKLHLSLLDDLDYIDLPVESQALAPLLWLMAAADSDDGTVPHDVERIAKRLRLPQRLVEKGLETLVSSGFMVVEGSVPSCTKPHQNLTLEETETETETEKRERQRSLRETFSRFWTAFDKKRSLPKAEKAWAKVPAADRERVIAAARAYARSTPDKQFRKDPTTWLNQQCWDDELVTPKTNGIPSVHNTDNYMRPGFDDGVRSGKL